MCNFIYLTWMNHLIQDIHRLNKRSLNFSKKVNLWKIFDVLACNCSSFINRHRVSELLTLGLCFLSFSLLSYGSYASAAAAACWTELSEGSAEDKAGACFNNACILEATSGQRQFLKRRFRDTPRATHVPGPMKNRKSGRTKQCASAEGLQSPKPVINQQGTILHAPLKQMLS